ncbi:MAG: DUF86 domain-containing protein [Armatimonadetes bacterium]|nr:DUF86 domain-containing protein [Armatimonadota bacterium]
MSRDFLPFLDDIRRTCEKVMRYTDGYTYEQFISDELRMDAVLRNLTIIGEAVKQIPPEFRILYPSIEWSKIARFRDLAIHRYFAVDTQIVWDIVQNHVPELLQRLNDLETPE